ncbi:MAG: hypothetical protein DWQ07_14755 [Chloroflexi bacterium]|nr:MAG: hypothetical protein DWQ07_14755 [Chloroflexota bacterium]MBL1195656.1 hypothetical protein [Chloroflexota bacterium]NOH12944.1 hypothetical protein [Chloroflexota bacterium]
MSAVEIMTTALVVMLFFEGNFNMDCRFFGSKATFHRSLAKSFSASVCAVSNLVFFIVHSAGRALEVPKHSQDLSHGQLSGLHQTTLYLWLKVQLLVTDQGQPVELFLTPGSLHNARALRNFAFDLPARLLITADKAYNRYVIEDFLEE